MVECLGLESTRRYSSAELTSIINQYMEENNLKDPMDHRIINLDLNLKKLFSTNEDRIFFKHIQGLIQKHVCRDDVEPPRNMNCRADFMLMKLLDKTEI